MPPTKTDDDVEVTYLDVDDPDTTIADDEDIEAEDFVDDVPTEIPVHGVATIEGKATGDGRGFKVGAIVPPPLPAPFGYEYEYGHGNDNSKAVVVGRIDEVWKVEHPDGYTEVRYRGVIFPDRPYANEAIQGIIDGVVTGVSVKIDDVVIDVSEQREEFIAQLKRDQQRAVDAEAAADTEVVKPDAMSDEDIEALVDAFIGDGTRPVTWISSARSRNFDMVHMPAFVEGYIGLGAAFADELTDEDRQALEDCGCEDWSANGFVVGPEDEDDEYDNIDLGYDFFRDVPAADRKKMAKAGTAMPDGSFPIANEQDLRNAIQAIGRAKDPAAAKAHIKKRAAALGKSDLIPDGWEAESVTAAAGTKDGPGWITHPRATARIRRYWTHGKGAAKIRWGVAGDFNRCRRQLSKYVQNPDWLAGLCANMHYEVLKRWPGPGVNRGHAAGGSLFAVVASGSVPEFDFEDDFTPYPAAFFTDPELSEPTQFTVTPEGRVYGHLALWDSCHVGMDGICWSPPTDDDYSYFYQGVVDSDAGPVRIGHLTYGTGHAPTRQNLVQATAHYDDPYAVRAHVRLYNDGYGIAYSGVLREGLTPAEVREVKANGAFSGDWRWVNEYTLALIGATSVNTPGLPIPTQPAIVASGGRQVTLITPPVIVGDKQEGDDQMTGQQFSAEELAAFARTAAREALAEQKREGRLEAARELKAQVRSERVAAARATVEVD